MEGAEGYEGKGQKLRQAEDEDEDEDEDDDEDEDVDQVEDAEAGKDQRNTEMRGTKDGRSWGKRKDLENKGEVIYTQAKEEKGLQREKKRKTGKNR